MLVITLAAEGMFGLSTTAMMIYGGNLGAILLRVLLTFGMDGVSRQLVRFEDLFCFASGLLMPALFYVERWTGLPLVLAGAARLSPAIAVQLAFVFLLSNLLPAVLFMPFLERGLALVARLWPAEDEADAAQPKFLTLRSLDDPATAVDLIPRELARLLASIEASVRTHRAGTDTSEVEDRRAADYATLTRRIEDYAGQLAVLPVQKSVAQRLNVAREATAVVGYLAEAYVQLRQSHRALRQFPGTEEVREQVLTALEALFAAAVQAVDTRQPEAIAHLREQSRRHSAIVDQARESCIRGAAADDVGALAVAERSAMLKLLADFELITWIIHRLSKLLEPLAQQMYSAPVAPY